jgi:SPP1 family predicted phage head-tail adaptor
MNEILILITVTSHVDEYGDLVTAETFREVFAKLSSIGQKEFYQAQAVGLQPELKFVLADYLDYQGETLVEHEGQRYRVLRTYRAGQELELTVYREVNPA